MLDPFAGSRGVQYAGMGGPALGFASEAADEPDSVFAYAARANVTKAPVFRLRLRRCLEPPRWTLWSASYGGQGKFDGDAAVIGSHDVTARDFGFAGGADYRLAPNTVIGAALSGGSISYSLGAASAADTATASSSASTARPNRAMPISRPRSTRRGTI